VKFLIDHNLSVDVAKGLTELAHDAVAVSAYGLSKADDEVIFERAATEDRIIISADTDFGTLLALRKTNKPSVVLLRLFNTMQTALEQVAIIEANLPNIKADLEAGSMVVIEPSQVRIRRLPIGGEG
jgi:predicted nuclease of predicted toxin-antitoxin system